MATSIGLDRPALRPQPLVLGWARSLHLLHRALSPNLRAGIGSNSGSFKVIVYIEGSLTLTEVRNRWYTVEQTSDYLSLFDSVCLLGAVLNEKTQLSFLPGNDSSSVTLDLGDSVI